MPSRSPRRGPIAAPGRYPAPQLPVTRYGPGYIWESPRGTVGSPWPPPLLPILTREQRHEQFLLRGR